MRGRGERAPRQRAADPGGPFSDAEIAGRQSGLRAAALDAGLEAMLLTSYPAIFHATGAPIHQFGRPAAIVLPVEGEPVMVCSVIEVEHVRAQSPIAAVRPYWDVGPKPDHAPAQPPWRTVAALVADALVALGLGRARLGVEDASIPWRLVTALRERLPALELVAAASLIDRQRVVKSPAELSILRAADAVADQGMAAMLSRIDAGVAARELYEAARSAMLDAVLGLEPAMPFHLRIDTGLGRTEWAAGHSEWTLWDVSTNVRPGAILVLICDAILWGITGNVERTVVVGEPVARVRRDFETMVRANEEAIAISRRGIALAEVDAACKRVLAAAGHTTRTGSGVGRGLISYEGGWRELLLDLRGYSDVVLEPGVAFSLEPDLQTPDGTYRHCNTIIITDDGAEVDSRLERGVIVV